MELPGSLIVALFTALAAGLAVLLYAVLIEPRMFALRRRTLKVLPPGSPDVYILHLSDLHMTENQRRKIRWVKNLSRLEPDLIVNTGDNLGSAGGIPEVISALSPKTRGGGNAEAPHGLYVWGSNDYFGPRPKNPFFYLFRPSTASPTRKNPRLDTEKLRKAFAANGWFDANNRQGIIAVKGVRIAVSGVDDPHLGYDRYSGFPPGSFPQTYDIRCGITHAPYQRILNRMAADGADLIFAGHTHGGQVCLPGNRALVTNCDLPVSYAKGLKVWDYNGSKSYLQVSAGLGTSKYAPIRFFCRPEAILLTLTAKEN